MKTAPKPPLPSWASVLPVPAADQICRSVKVHCGHDPAAAPLLICCGYKNYVHFLPLSMDQAGHKCRSRQHSIVALSCSSIVGHYFMSQLVSSAGRNMCPARPPQSLPWRHCFHCSPLSTLQARQCPSLKQHWRPSAPCTLSLMRSASVAGLCFAATGCSMHVSASSVALWDPWRLWTLCIQCLPLSILQA